MPKSQAEGYGDIRTGAAGIRKLNMMYYSAFHRQAHFFFRKFPQAGKQGGTADKHYAGRKAIGRAGAIERFISKLKDVGHPRLYYFGKLTPGVLRRVVFGKFGKCY